MASLSSIVPVFAFLAALNAPWFAGAAASEENLYQARTIVTGEREETRIPALADCLADVLVKVSGDPRLANDPVLPALAKQATTFVEAYRYRDRLAGIPIHDEQGSRDRPYDLFVTFDRAKIDAALRHLGRGPWTAPRPRLVIFLIVRNGPTNYILASDGERGRDQRESLEAASWQMGMPIVVPTTSALARAGLTVETLPAANAQSLDRVTKAVAGDWALVGRLEWRKGTLGWAADWRLHSPKKSYAWQIRDVNFDDAFRSAMRGAAQIASGNGEPR
jgi:hypothetical protein